MTLSEFVRAPEEVKQGVYKGVMEKASQRQAQTLLECAELCDSEKS